MSNVVISAGEGSYTGPITVVAWMFVHPWMTVFIILAVVSAVEELFKALGKRWAK